MGIARMELRVGNKYRLGRKIGSGSFGDIFLGNCTALVLQLLAAVNAPPARHLNRERHSGQAAVRLCFRQRMLAGCAGA